MLAYRWWITQKQNSSFLKTENAQTFVFRVLDLANACDFIENTNQNQVSKNSLRTREFGKVDGVILKQFEKRNDFFW